MAKVFCGAASVLFFCLWSSSSIRIVDGANLDLLSEIRKSESNFNSSLGLVLSDLSAEIASRNRTFISEKLAQIRAKKLRQKDEENNFEHRSPNFEDRTPNFEDESTIPKKFGKRLKRKIMKKRCLAMTKEFEGSGMQVRRRVW